MTRKDYVMIADSLNSLRLKAIASSDRHGLWLSIVNDIALRLHQDNKKFDIDRFIKHCDNKDTMVDNLIK